MSRLKDLRKERGYTQIKMQHLTGIDQSDYSKIENGKRYYTFEQCRKIRNLTPVPIHPTSRKTAYHHYNDRQFFCTMHAA